MQHLEKIKGFYIDTAYLSSMATRNIQRRKETTCISGCFHCVNLKNTRIYEFHERDLLPNCKVKKLAISEHSNEETWTISHFLDWSLSFKDFIMCVMSKQAIVGNILIPSVVLILMKFSSWWQIGGDIVYFCHIILGTLLLYGFILNI